MTRRTTPSCDGYGSVRADEVLPLRELARRLGWGQRTIRAAQRDGLITLQYGKMKYVRGVDVAACFEKLAGVNED